MNDPVNQARRRLTEGGFTCVVLNQGEEFCSHERGVKPLLMLLQSNSSYHGAVAADKTVGAGAAHLYVLLGVKTLWANVISASALQILQSIGISVTYETLVPHIINRKGDGVCPIETAVAPAQTSQEAYDLIVEALKRLQANG